MEEHLSVKLFERAHGKVRLTEDGEILYTRISEGFRRQGVAKQILLSMRQEQHGLLRAARDPAAPSAHPGLPWLHEPAADNAPRRRR